MKIYFPFNKVLILSVLVLGIGANAESGPGVSGGGNPCASKWTNAGTYILELVRNDPFFQKHIENFSRLEEKIKSAIPVIVFDPLKENGGVVYAKYHQDLNDIEVNDVWCDPGKYKYNHQFDNYFQGYNKADRYTLVFHEFLCLAGEKDQGFYISGKLHSQMGISAEEMDNRLIAKVPMKVIFEALEKDGGTLVLKTKEFNYETSRDWTELAINCSEGNGKAELRKGTRARFELGTLELSLWEGNESGTDFHFSNIEECNTAIAMGQFAESTHIEGQFDIKNRKIVRLLPQN